MLCANIHPQVLIQDLVLIQEGCVLGVAGDNLPAGANTVSRANTGRWCIRDGRY